MNPSEDEALLYFRKLANALQTVHFADLIHCDVHPKNILIRPSGEPVLIDFGSAKSLRPGTLTVPTTENGFTPYEQGKGNPRPTWDVYALAATIYFAVTGEMPQPAINRKLYGDLLKSPRLHKLELSNWLGQAIMKGMALEPQDRPQSMQALSELLNPPPPKPASVQQPKAAKLVRPSNNPSKRQTAAPKQEVIRQPRVAKLASSNSPLKGLASTNSLPSVTPPVETLPFHSKQDFPWFSLSFLLLGYVPVGLIFGFALGDASGLVLALANVWILALGLAALPGAGKGSTLALALALIFAEASLLFMIRVDIWAWTLAGACAIFGGLSTSGNKLNKRYQRRVVFFILARISTLGLFLGGGVGCLLKFAGVKLWS